MLELVDPEDPDRYDVLELQRLLYDLHAIWRLHRAQESEEDAALRAPAANRGGSRAST